MTTFFIQSLSAGEGRGHDYIYLGALNIIMASEIRVFITGLHLIPYGGWGGGGIENIPSG